MSGEAARRETAGGSHGATAALRRQLAATLDMAAQVIDATIRERALRPGDGKRLIDALKQSPWFDGLASRALMAVEAELPHAERDGRKDLFQRVMVHPLESLLDSGAIDRRYLSNYFAFFRHLLGDDRDELQIECEAVADVISPTAPEPDWKTFYQHPRIQGVYFKVLGRIARSFARFDLRRQWFIDLMSYDPATEAVSAHVYIPSREHEPLPPFDGQHFRLLFHALFAPARNPTPEQRAIIEERLGMTPEQAFGRFLGALDDN
ncbi:MAG: hypothetical protein ACT60Q_14360 [Ferrovibrionaceae bacterium]